MASEPVAQVATEFGSVVSGIVSALIILGIVYDRLSDGQLGQSVQTWLGLDQLQHNNAVMQAFLIDLGESHNALVDVLVDENEISEAERPPKVDVERYKQYLEGDLPMGTFVRHPDDDDDDFTAAFE